MHKGIVGRVPTSTDQGPGSITNDIGRGGGNERYLREYIQRKQESDGFFAKAPETKKLTFDEWYLQRLIDFDGVHPSAHIIWKAAQENK